LRRGERSRPAGLLVGALLCFAVAAVSFGGLILRTDYAGRAIFGAAWGALGVVWLGKYFIGGRNSRDAEAEDRDA
jgi:hypothetical protein